MSLINNNQDIYNEMEFEKSEKKGSSHILSKVVGSVLFLSVGFAVGNIYSASLKDNNLPVLNQNNSNYIERVSSVQSNLPNDGVLSTSQIASLNENSVVEIKISATTNTILGNYTSTGSGSGVIISKDGYILTNNHVIDSAEKVTVRLHDGTEYEASVVGSDSKTDVGIIKVDANNLIPVTIGDSDSLVVGDLAVVIGNPLGQLGGTVTDGIISALEREINLEGTKMNLIQTNAAINRGNSGGGLFDKTGKLVGIVVAKSSGIDIEGLGFAIPINDVKDVINDILDLGYVSGRPFLGVQLTSSKQTESNNSIWSFLYGQSVTSTSYGAYVSGVVEGSAADKAGIKVDDQIISVNDEMTSSAQDVTSAIAEYEISDTVKIGIVRNNKMLTLEATLQEYKGE